MNLKKCSKCRVLKNEETDFYTCKGYRRAECKACTVSRNVIYQRENQVWRNRFVDAENKRTYMQAYYARNKEKFVEYRERFKKANPDYHTVYQREMRERRRLEKKGRLRRIEPKD